MILMNIDGVEGTSGIKDHEKWIKLDSLRWDVGRNISCKTGETSDRTGEVVEAGEITATKQMDSTSAKLFETAGGTEGKAVEIHFLAGAGKEAPVYATWTLENALVSHYTVDGSVEPATETVQLNFTKITVESTPKGPDEALGSPYPVTFNRETGVLE